MHRIILGGEASVFPSQEDYDSDKFTDRIDIKIKPDKTEVFYYRTGVLKIYSPVSILVELPSGKTIGLDSILREMKCSQ
jgi:hypothetical protein